ncbi:MAG TPA: hypothetical protein VJX16_17250 [Terriglobales bacterium]|nr:hypothetical protein [Terriglobales bacterium]
MRIERGPYIAVISPMRVPDRHASVRFRYTIIRQATDRMLMIEGSAGTEKEAGEVVKRYLDRFQEQQKRNA